MYVMFHDMCWNCKDNKQKFRCTGCGFALYCSQMCQKEHWKVLHGSHCKYLSGKKSLPGATHLPENCQNCKSGPASHKEYMDTNLEKLKRELIAITKYSDKKGIDYEKYEKEKSLYECVNLPFEIGELSGKHLDCLDKLLSLLLALLSMLQFSLAER